MTTHTRVWRSVYYLALLLILTPLLDLFSNAWPIQAGTMMWRFGFLGLLGNNLLTPFLGLVLAAVAAATLEQPRVLKTVAVVNFILCVVVIAAIVLFALDALQLHKNVNPQVLERFETGSAIAMVKYVLALIGFAILGRSALKAAGKRGEHGRSRQKKESPEAGLLIR
ncbi:MAG TPA: hypothetical protein VFL93_15160 [Longimicrobiaceae bacterium]|nr:hypothetical protein [Longimicrobiaceae bacterium]